MNPGLCSAAPGRWVCRPRQVFVDGRLGDPDLTAGLALDVGDVAPCSLGVQSGNGHAQTRGGLLASQQSQQSPSFRGQIRVLP